MVEMSVPELAAFLDIYGCGDDELNIDGAVLESLVQRGLLSREPGGQFNPTDLGDAVYQRMQNDEPYEGI
jgi:hypothetical protein